MQPDNYRVPQHDDEVLILPGRGELSDVVVRNHRLVSAYSFCLAGRPFQDVLKASRDRLRQAAAEYTCRLGLEPRFGGSDLVVSCGHQPGFPHPGVWIKNHLVAHLAERLKATAINTIINSDHTQHIGFHALCTRDGRLERRTFQLVDPSRWTTLEDASVANGGDVGGFCDEIRRSLSHGLVGHRFELFARFLRAASRVSLRVSDLLTYARRWIEHHDGLGNLELPISLACETDGFRMLLLHILRHAPRFAAIYNRALHEYRSLNNVRSPANPLPDLAEGPDAWELPFWLTPPGQPRTPCFVKIDGDRYTLISGTDEVALLRQGQIDDGQGAVGILRRLADQGFRFRLKAVTNSIFSRLLLGDIFVHGIGGAKYDLVTDQVIAEFFEVPVPAGVVASATVLLHVEGVDPGELDARSIKARIHTMLSNPAAVAADLLPRDEHVASLVDEKQQLVEALRNGSRRERRRRFARAKQIDAALAGKLEPFVERERRRLEQAQRARSQYDALQARDYPFCLFPAGRLADVYGFAAQ